MYEASAETPCDRPLIRPISVSMRAKLSKKLANKGKETVYFSQVYISSGRFIYSSKPSVAKEVSRK
jgi:hypothetical protein